MLGFNFLFYLKIPPFIETQKCFTQSMVIAEEVPQSCDFLSPTFSLANFFQCKQNNILTFVGCCTSNASDPMIFLVWKKGNERKDGLPSSLQQELFFRKSWSRSHTFLQRQAAGHTHAGAGVRFQRRKKGEGSVVLARSLAEEAQLQQEQVRRVGGKSCV